MEVSFRVGGSDVLGKEANRNRKTETEKSNLSSFRNIRGMFPVLLTAERLEDDTVPALTIPVPVFSHTIGDESNSFSAFF